MYRPIEPIQEPSLKEVLLGVRGGPLEIGVVKHLEEEEVVKAVNLGVPYTKLIAYKRTHVFHRLNEDPIKLRNNGVTADLEVYVDTFTFVQDEDVVKSESEVYPPLDPFTRDWGEGSYYQRFTMGYVYEGIEVERASSVIWDGRYGYCVDRSLEQVDAGDRVEGVKRGVRERIKNPGMPKRSFAIGNEGTTRRPENFGEGVNMVKYLDSIESWLNINYNSNSVPKVPVSTEGLTAYYKGVLEDTDRYDKVLAAVLDGDYFVEWIVIVRPGG
jgi:hypothetical protein